MKKTTRKTEYGDWQTPISLANEVCHLLVRRGSAPSSVIEPTFGKGAFLTAALRSFPTIKRAIGVEINSFHMKAAEKLLSEIDTPCRVDLRQADFFRVDWTEATKSLPEPILIIGNPPWVTNAELRALGSANLPYKSNFQNHRGIDAITGKSNFDISESMLLQSIEWMRNRKATLAMLCKTAVARKILTFAWCNKYPLGVSAIYRIDAQEHFGASVDACLLLIETSESSHTTDCQVYESVNQKVPSTTFGYRQNRLVADVKVLERYMHLLSKEKGAYIWRSGIKHDCSKIMELRQAQGLYRNGYGETVELEEDFLYPMLKSSDLGKGPPFEFAKRMIVTQKQVGESTDYIKCDAPKTWRYLNGHADLLNARASSIYKNRPRFCVFGVGDYSFAPWKLAISGFYKLLTFHITGPFEGKPVVFDDTCYFIGCESEEEATCLAELLNSETAKEFFSSLIFWDAKRPITINLLGSLDIAALARQLGRHTELGKCRRAPNSTLQLFFLD
jgi:hypothetical protein